MQPPQQDWRPLEALLGHDFRDHGLLELALTHASRETEHNERLEFLGDGILDLVVSLLLFQRFPKAREGELTEWKALLVSRETLSRVGERLSLEQWLLPGEHLRQRGSLPRSLLGNAVEALLAAVYLDCDEADALPTCRKLAEQWLGGELARLPQSQERKQAKQLLQNWAQQKGSLPIYVLTDFHDHPDTQAFQIAAEWRGRRFPGAWGASKKEAERRAAWEAILLLRAEGRF